MLLRHTHGSDYYAKTSRPTLDNDMGKVHETNKKKKEAKSKLHAKHNKLKKMRAKVKKHKDDKDED